MTESITRTYTVRMDVAAPLARRRIWSRLVWLGGTAAVAGAAVSLLTMANVTAFPIVVALAISVVSLVIVGRRTVAREVNALASYRLTLGETSLRRVVDGVAPAEMGRDEVTRIMEGPFGLIVEGSGRSVLVPTVLDGYEEARQQLVSWRAITSPERTRLACRRPPRSVETGTGVRQAEKLGAGAKDWKASALRSAPKREGPGLNT